MRNLFLLSFMLAGCIANAADSAYVKKITDTLACPVFFGRGYVADGMKKAGDFIVAEMSHIGLHVQEQSFGYPVNTFPGKMQLTVNGMALVPGAQFLVGTDSRSC